MYISKKLLSVAIPIALSTLVINLSTFIDLTTVMNCLKHAIDEDSRIILDMYANSIPTGVNIDILPEYLYGSYSGLASSIFNLIPAITAAFGISALPVVSRAWVNRDFDKLEETVSSILRITMLVAVPAGLGISVLAEPILTLLYPARMMEVSIVAPILEIMGVSAIFVAITTPINSVLQAVGKERLPMMILIVGATIKLITNYTLVSRPEINIQGVPYGTLLCYLVILVLGSCAIVLTTGLKLKLHKIYLKPVICGILSSVVASYVYDLIPATNSIKILVAVGFAILIYLFTVLLSGAICQSDLEMLPINEKVLKTLEKFRLIG